MADSSSNPRRNLDQRRAQKLLLTMQVAVHTAHRRSHLYSHMNQVESQVSAAVTG